MTKPNPFPGCNFNPTYYNAPVQASVSKNYRMHTAGNNGTLIAVVLDESGSMSSCRDATISGFNEFVQGQRSHKLSSAAYLTLVKFDAPKITTVYDNCLIDDVPNLTTDTYRPNGGTNLYDAIGQTINRVNSVLAKHPKSQRPGVIIVIMTDGAENSSREFSNKDIQEMVKSAEQADWTFQFLGANIDAFQVGSQFGMNSANSFNYSVDKMSETFTAMSASTVRVRTAKAAGIDTQAIYASGLYTADELKNMKS